MKKFVLAGVLSLSAICFAGTKTYEINLTAPAKAGNVTLAKGAYKLQIQGTNAVFTDEKTRQTFTAPVKIGTTTRKNQFTSVDTATDAGSDKITSIELGGSNTQIAF